MDINDYLARFEAKGRTLVVGSKQYKGKADRRALYQDAVGLDLEAGEGVDIVHDLEYPLPESLGTFDHIDLCSVLEHVQRPWLLCHNIECLMNDGATILVNVPFIWRIHAYPSDYWRMSKEALPILFPWIRWLDRSYMASGEIRKKPQGYTQGITTYMEKTELVAFGILDIDHASDGGEGEAVPVGAA